MKRLIFVFVILAMVFTLSGCYNKQLIDLNYKFDRAYIRLPNGQCVEGRVDSWLDFEDADQIQVKINGTTYLTHISNVVLVND